MKHVRPFPFQKFSYEGKCINANTKTINMHSYCLDAIMIHPESIGMRRRLHVEKHDIGFSTVGYYKLWYVTVHRKRIEG
jgi:hypothetical protein